MIHIFSIPQKPDPKEDFNFLISQSRRLNTYEIETLSHATELVRVEKERLEKANEPRTIR